MGVDRRSGFTLAETIIALVLFIGVVIPLALFFAKNSESVRDSDLISALCVLEQESRLAQFDPRAIRPSKSRTIAGAPWKVECSVQSADPKLCTIRAIKNGHVISTVMFYASPEKKAR
jgi:competence protein ComGF